MWWIYYSIKLQIFITSCSEFRVWAGSKSEDIPEPVVDRPEEVVDGAEEVAEEGAEALSLCGRQKENQSQHENEATAPEGRSMLTQYMFINMVNIYGRYDKSVSTIVFF